MRKLVVLLLSVLLMSCILSAQLYVATTLPNLGKGNPVNGLTVALGINNSGTVAGTSQLPNNQRHAVYWKPDGTVVDLGTLGGSGAFGVGNAINTSGAIAGTATFTSDLSLVHPFLRTPDGVTTDLGALGPGKTHTALALNDSNQVVGFSCFDSVGTCHAFFWTTTTGMLDLGTFGGTQSDAEGINSQGHVVGYASRADGSRHAFLWTGGGLVELLPGSTFESYAAAINDSDQVVGSFISPVDSTYHAMLWDATNGMRDLGVLPVGGWSEAFDINDAGDVVGFARDPGNIGYGLIWRHPSYTLQKLSSLTGGLALTQATTGINGSGQIAANGATRPQFLQPTWLKFSAKTINFGSVAVGTSIRKAVTIQNIGSTGIAITSIGLKGALTIPRRILVPRLWPRSPAAPSG